MKSILSAVFIACNFAAGFAQELPPVERIESPTPAFHRMRQVEGEAKRLLEAGDIDGLERLADALRQGRERLDGGTWILARFYRQISRLPDDPEAAAERIRFFERWVAEKPESRTAPVALAEALTSYAWDARGSGWASSVSEDGWRLFRERLAQAWDALEVAGEPRCPGWYAAAQTVALGQNWDRDRYFAMVDEAIKNEPTYGTYYTNTCYWLLPRWHGEPGEFPAWIAEKADAVPEAERDRHYAFLVWMAERMPVSGEIVFDEGFLDWERTKRGFREWIAAVPDNRMVRFQFLRLALMADDPEVAREQFDVLGGLYFPPMWKSEAEFEAARKFAYFGEPNPFIERDEPDVPVLSPRLVDAVAAVVTWGVRLIGGFLAGLALFILAVQRRQPWAGALAWLASIFAVLPFGTLGTLAPAVALWMYLRRRGTSGPPPSAPVSGWLVLLAMVVLSAAYLGLQFMASILVAIPFGLGNRSGDGTGLVTNLARDGTLFTIAASAGWLTLLLLLIFCGAGVGLPKRLAWTTQRWRLGALWVGAGFVGISLLGWLVDPYLDERSREGIRLFALGLDSPIPTFLAVVLIAPFVEELVFRGYAFTGLAARWGAPIAGLITAVVFTALHVQYGWAGLSLIFVFGLLLAVMRWHTGSVIPCIILHVLNNLSHMLNLAIGEVP
ncbi:MAG: CPBP family glutamic-type intramembrane protease [Terrimicrobiaceae bacterium]|nr:CPBP family glutamic-type intramembrane protease [Terrimicrobiaceae bacterium]